MKSLSLALAFTLTWAAAAGAEKTVSVDYSAPVDRQTPPAVATVNVDSLQRQTNELQGAVGDDHHAEAELHNQAGRLFDRINESGAERVVDARLQGWGKPDPYTAGAPKDEGGVDGMLNRVGAEIGRSRAAKDPTPHADVTTAYRYGKWMRQQGMMDYTDSLNSNQLGVYVYRPNAPVGIYFNTQFFELQNLLGDAFAAATAVHESAHSRDHAEGRLNPKEVKKGEMSAYQSEYWWLRTIDPKGHKLAWARYTFCSDYHGETSNNVCSYLEHLAQIQRYGSQGKFEELVTSLGYRDRTSDPSSAGSAEVVNPWVEDRPIEAHYHGDGDGH